MADDANKLLASISIDRIPTASIELAIVLSAEFGRDIALAAAIDSTTWNGSERTPLCRHL